MIEKIISIQTSKIISNISIDKPLCAKGYVEIKEEEGKKKKIRLTDSHKKKMQEN